MKTLSEAVPDEWGKGCAPTNEVACMAWARQARDQPDEYRGFLEPSCDRGHGPACAKLAQFLTEDELAADGEATDLYKRACEFGYGSGCLKWSETLEGDEKQAVLEKGCALKCVWCCKNAGLPDPAWD